LPNIRSAIKRMRQNVKRHLHNRFYTSRARTMVKKARMALADPEGSDPRQEILKAVSALDKAAEKGVIHKNNAARRKSRLMKRLAALEKAGGE